MGGGVSVKLKSTQTNKTFQIRVSTLHGALQAFSPRTTKRENLFDVIIVMRRHLHDYVENFEILHAVH